MYHIINHKAKISTNKQKQLIFILMCTDHKVRIKNNNNNFHFYMLKLRGINKHK